MIAGEKLILPDGKEYVVHSHSGETHRCGKVTYVTVLRREDAEIVVSSTGRTAQNILLPEVTP